MKCIFIILSFLILSASAAVGQVDITTASGGTDIARSKAANGSSPAFTTLGDIVILETLIDDFAQSQSNKELVLTAPSNWWFNPGVGSVSNTLGDDITALSVVVDTFTIAVSISTANGLPGADTIDDIIISGIQVQSIDGNITPAAGNIVRTKDDPGLAQIYDVVEDATNFGSLSTDPLTPMPVELTSFTAGFDGIEVKLNWSTATETDNYGFEVYRSGKLDRWELIGFVNGHGNSSSPKEYEYTDNLLTLPENQLVEELGYKLKQIDTDGTFEYYGLTEPVNLINITGIGDDSLPVEFELMQNYPNPFNPSSTIKFSLPESGHTLVEVFNSIGEKAATLVNRELPAGFHQVEWNASGFSSGIYLYRITTKNFSDIKKMILLR